MAKIERWIVASKMVPVFDNELLARIAALGGSVGGGWCEVHQHVHVTPESKEAIEELLVRNGYRVLGINDPSIVRPGSGRFQAVGRTSASGRFQAAARPPSGRYPPIRREDHHHLDPDAPAEADKE